MTENTKVEIKKDNKTIVTVEITDNENDSKSNAKEKSEAKEKVSKQYLTEKSPVN